MKHLKKFNESVSSDEVIENLEDICRDLEDIYFEVEIRHREGMVYEYIIYVSQGTRSSWWSNDRDKDFFYSTQQHLENYMRDLGYKMKIEYDLDDGDPIIKFNFFIEESNWDN
jgi:hypothetical protein